MKNYKYVYQIYYRNRFPQNDMVKTCTTLTSARSWAKRLAKSYKYVTLQKESSDGKEVTIYESYYDGKKR